MTIKNVDPKTLQKWLANNEAILIDVREPFEHNIKNIKQANLIPLSKITKCELPQHTNKKIVIHCQGGKRSQTACEKLLREDPSLEIYNLEGGIIKWEKECEGASSCTSSCLTLDRQVQLAIGILVLASIFLAYFLSEKFLLLTAFIALGLIFAALSGICSLSLLLAKCPWNKKNNPKKL